MSVDELREALDGLYAYDRGSTNSGVHDEALRDRCIQELHKLSREDEARMVRDMWLSDEAIEQGYGLEDLADFLKWLADYMQYDVT